MEKKGKKSIFCKMVYEPRFVKKNENNEAVLIFFLISKNKIIFRKIYLFKFLIKLIIIFFL